MRNMCLPLNLVLTLMGPLRLGGRAEENERVKTAASRRALAKRTTKRTDAEQRFRARGGWSGEKLTDFEFRGDGRFDYLGTFPSPVPYEGPKDVSAWWRIDKGTRTGGLFFSVVNRGQFSGSALVVSP